MKERDDGFGEGVCIDRESWKYRGEAARGRRAWFAPPAVSSRQTILFVFRVCTWSGDMPSQEVRTSAAAAASASAAGLLVCQDEQRERQLVLAGKFQGAIAGRADLLVMFQRGNMRRGADFR